MCWSGSSGRSKKLSNLLPSSSRESRDREHIPDSLLHHLHAVPNYTEKNMKYNLKKKVENNIKIATRISDENISLLCTLPSLVRHTYTFEDKILFENGFIRLQDMMYIAVESLAMYGLPWSKKINLSIPDENILIQACLYDKYQHGVTESNINETRYVKATSSLWRELDFNKKYDNYMFVTEIQFNDEMIEYSSYISRYSTRDILENKLHCEEERIFPPDWQWHKATVGTFHLTENNSSKTKISIRTGVKYRTETGNIIFL